MLLTTAKYTSLKHTQDIYKKHIIIEKQVSEMFKWLKSYSVKFSDHSENKLEILNGSMKKFKTYFNSTLQILYIKTYGWN